MEVFRIVVVLQALVCYEALQNLTSLKPPESKEHGEESQLYITHMRPCSWTVTSPGKNQSLPVFKRPLHPLATQVCQSLGCGEVYKLIERPADPNSSCLTGCSHHNSTLINCSRAAAGDCVVMSEVICAQLYITPSVRPCSWTVTSPGKNQSLPVFKQALHPLATQVCQSLGCGEVYKLIERSADPNSSCLTGCSHHNSTLINCSRAAAGDCRVMSEVICDAPYITPASSHCVWNLWSPKAELTVTLSEEVVQRLPSEICQSLGCGEAFNQKTSRAPANSTCLTDCTYHSSHLQNCSTVVRSNCSVLSEITCGNSQVQLTGGSHRCAGRVELWRAGHWGTVCDDEWDKQDADVVCAQLGCGSAISVTGQGKPYGQGRGPIYRDELNCTGEEKSLWECPAVMDHHDCGHKEDAGVVCLEYSLRLTGGRDRCSGRVEVHRKGAWGTVCDDSWDKEGANLACAMLNCGDAGYYTGFKETFTHNNGTRWFYSCPKSAKILWDCKEMAITAAIPHVCDHKAARVICKKSIEFFVPSTSKATTPVLTTVQMTTATPKGSWSLELLGCIGLSSALLIALIINIILCCCARKRKALVVQQQYPNLQTAAEPEENTYRDSVHLVKVTTNDHTSNAHIMPPQMWTQSSVESGSYDTDYEPSDSGPDSTFPLSTFRNSMRYSAEGRTPGLRNTNLQSVTEEDSGGPGDAAMRGYQHPYIPNGAFQGVTTAPSEDSFETSSTSSGECYENTGLCNAENYENTADNSVKPPHPLLSNYNTENFLNQTEDVLQSQSNTCMFNHDQGLVRKSSSGENSPIYSPVSADTDLYSPVSADTDLYSPVSARTDPYSSDSDYDDVAYLQRPDQ